MTDALTQLFLRDLDRLKKELIKYKAEKQLWNIDREISNSAGHLALHLIGNLNHWIGALIAKNGYIRDRHNEFEGAPVPVEQLMQRIDELKKLIEVSLKTLSVEDLKGPFPGPIPYDMNTEQFLLHIYAHFSYHLGQINYHRRLLDS